MGSGSISEDNHIQLSETESSDSGVPQNKGCNVSNYLVKRSNTDSQVVSSTSVTSVIQVLTLYISIS